MRFYRVSFDTVSTGSEGFEWHTSKADAERSRRTFLKERVDDTPDAEIVEVQFEPTRSGILWALNNFAVHPDNG